MMPENSATHSAHCGVYAKRPQSIKNDYGTSGYCCLMQISIRLCGNAGGLKIAGAWWGFG